MENINVIDTTEKAIEFCKNYVERAIGRKAETRRDNASKYEKDGQSYSYLWSLGNTSNAISRFETWLTARKDVFFDIYIGDAYTTTETIDDAVLKPYYVGRGKRGKTEVENIYRHVPMSVAIEFYAVNELLTETAQNVQHLAKETTAKDVVKVC